MDIPLVEFWICENCKKPYRSQPATFRQLAPYLPSPATGIASVFLLCDACNAICSYSKKSLPVPCMKDNSGSERFVYTAQIFSAHIGCADSACRSPIPVLVPTTQYWREQDIKAASHFWQPDPQVVCTDGHPALTPVGNPDVRLIFEEVRVSLKCPDSAQGCGGIINLPISWFDYYKDIFCGRCGKSFILQNSEISNIKKRYGA
jgi:hypothetical protein